MSYDMNISLSEYRISHFSGFRKSPLFGGLYSVSDNGHIVSINEQLGVSITRAAPMVSDVTVQANSGRIFGFGAHCLAMFKTPTGEQKLFSKETEASRLTSKHHNMAVMHPTLDLM